MHAEHLRCVCGRQALYVADASLQASLQQGWGVCCTKGKVGLEYGRTIAAAEQVGQQYSVMVVCHSSTIVDLARHILQSCPGNIALSQQQYNIQKVLCNFSS